MPDEHTNEPPDDFEDARVDGGVTAREESVEYLETEINLLRPGTPFMRDHLRVVWATFFVWVAVVWGPILLTWLAPGVMTTAIPGLGFPLHYFLVALGAPTGALILAAVYARQRDRLDQKYSIDPDAAVETAESGSEDAAAADGGVER
jgi:putative solute:sodium symporter small subunit